MLQARKIRRGPSWPVGSGMCLQRRRSCGCEAAGLSSMLLLFVSLLFSAAGCCGGRYPRIIIIYVVVLFRSSAS